MDAIVPLLLLGQKIIVEEDQIIFALHEFDQ
jgi:hypothetical protein